MQSEKVKPYFTGHGLGYRFKDSGDHLFYESEGEVEELKVKPVSLADLGLKRVSGRRVIRK